jgi:transposase
MFLNVVPARQVTHHISGTPDIWTGCRSNEGTRNALAPHCPDPNTYQPIFDALQ